MKKLYDLRVCGERGASSRGLHGAGCEASFCCCSKGEGEYEGVEVVSGYPFLFGGKQWYHRRLPCVPRQGQGNARHSVCAIMPTP